ncbi:MAG: fumarylacetoacetate hydrolase family protein [Deltaproteobacteria bacterium]|nr:fumarylacetoacetate hydrolase family protein [Deltaproteobacteria bacterium]
MLTGAQVDEYARELDNALLEHRELPPLTQTHGAFSDEDGYRIQARGIALRAARGDVGIGWKMGLTSAAKRVQMNLKSSIHGVLTKEMRVRGSLRAAEGVHPKIEPEIAFVLSRPLTGVASRQDAWACVAQVGCAMEILDSRFVGFKYFSLPDVIADDASSFRFVLADSLVDARAIDPERLATAQMRMSIDGVVKQEAPGSAISGHPLESLVELAQQTAARGLTVPAGSIVLAGAATVAEPLRAGTLVRLDVEHLPPAELRIE